MSTKVDKQLFVMPDNTTEITTLLSDTPIPWQHEEQHTYTVEYYDTFDWRLYVAGLSIELQKQKQGQTFLVCKRIDAITAIYQVPYTQHPDFVWNLPPTWHNLLEPIIKMRKLLPLFSMQAKIELFHFLNKDEKTVARLQKEVRIITKKKKSKLTLKSKEMCALMLLPLRGYENYWLELYQFLHDKGFKNTAKAPLFLDKSLQYLDKKPLDYYSKLNLTIDPSMDAKTATLYILQELLKTMKANEKGTIKNIDSEFLHDFRVAIRRTRSALSQIKGVFADNVVDEFKQKYALLGQWTGATRDMDVYLLKFSAYQQSLPVAIQKDLQPLYSFLEHKQKMEQKALRRLLMSKQYHDIMESWEHFLYSDSNYKEDNALRPITEVANERIWKMYKRVVKEGKGIYDDTPAEALHELRKSCKKLRYLMEFFSSLYDKNKIKALIKVLKVLQENLGDFQDFEVQVYHLRHFATEMREQRAIPVETIMAMGVLVEHLLAGQYQARREFSQRFKEFILIENQTLFRDLFQGAK